MKTQLAQFLKPLYLFFLRMGINLKYITLLRFYGKYRSDLNKFKKLGGTVTHNFAILSDYGAQAGSIKGHYFHQDLLVASFIYKNNPERHLDIGSRVDGFVAHVASFRAIEIMDLRDLESTGHKNISYMKADLMNEGSAQCSIADSISCLHAIEHFGLGRYGDPIDPNGHKKGFNNLIRMLKPGGVLYISFPIGIQNEIYFNAHRVFHPKDIFNWLPDMKIKLNLQRFDYVDDLGELHQNSDINLLDNKTKYGCGIYTFRKN